MEKKKNFVKPEMKVIEMKSEVRVMAGSGCIADVCGTDCGGNTAG